MKDYNIFWLRRDLRLHDNAGLFHALKSGVATQVIFIFDSNILDLLTDKSDARVTFNYKTLEAIHAKLRSKGSSLMIYYGDPIKVWRNLSKDNMLKSVYINKDYEPYAKERDSEIEAVLAKNGIKLHQFKDHVIFDNQEVVKDDKSPYTVYTPYKNKWMKKLQSGMKTPLDDSSYLYTYPCSEYAHNYRTGVAPLTLSLSDLGFKESNIAFPPRDVPIDIIEKYEENRNFPNVNGTSKISVHLRFGTVSIRELVKQTLPASTSFLNELIWRDFYAMILHHFPYVQTSAFRPKYEFIQWRNDENEFEAWCAGKTGYPLVDAGMKELNETGFMHNRVRMLTASFLTKHLLIDWRKGERYFARKLLDYDLASNNGGWQWAAGCGTDAAPYFRIFNPYTQAAKFDKENVYIKKWIPEFGTANYAKPIVEHKFARQRCLEAYKKGLLLAEKEGQ